MNGSVFDSIKRGLEEAVAHARGEDVAARVSIIHVPETVDVRALRGSMGMTQHAFAARYGFSLSAVREWEQGRRQPERSARILLKVIEREPEAVERALHE